jgi:tellurite resistance protein TehA-like permease
MATGIVSLAAWFAGMPRIAQSLFLLNNLLYVILWLLTLARLAFFRARLLADLAGHGSGAGFLTMVAGTCMLGIQYLIVADEVVPATALWCLGAALWIFLIYAFFAAVTLADVKPGIETGLNGAWLLATVSTQSIAVLGTLLAPRSAIDSRTLLFISLMAYLLGCMFYLLIINLIIYRFSFFRLSPEAMSPPYWINMGAVAITTLAGARLLQSTSHWPMLQELHPFVLGFTLFFWTTATWWIPLLVILGVWRHVVKRHPISYHPQYWSIVFPLGMYTVSTYQLSRTIDAPFLPLIPQFVYWIAISAWLATFAAMLVSLARALRSGQARP